MVTVLEIRGAMHRVYLHNLDKNMSEKLSIDQVKKISPKVLLKLIQRAKDFLKKNDIFIDMCKEFDVDPDFIDFVPVKFGDLDVSAQTAFGVITLNYKLLCDGNFFNDYGYLVHESRHYLDQCFGSKPTQGADDGKYLDNPFEEEAFKDQIGYIDDIFGKQEAENYTDNLLDHHEIKNKKERKDKKKTLMDLVDK